MAIRDLALALIMVVAIPASFLRPWIGALVFAWLSFMNPHRLGYGTHDFQFALITAVLTLAGLPFTSERARLPRTIESYLLIALWAWFGFTTLFALYPDAAWEEFVRVSKILLMTFVTILLLQDRRKLRLFLYVIAFSIGFYGFKGGAFAYLTGFRYQVLGPEGSFIAMNTEIGLALNMVLPILLFLRRDEKRAWARHLLLATFFLSIGAIVSTYSRGAFLGLGAVLASLCLKSRAKLIAIVLFCAGVFVAPALLPDAWFDRMDSIATHEDASSQARLKAWKLSYRIALDHPILGNGFRTYTTDIYAKYVPEDAVSSSDAHSIYFQVLGEHGFIGITLYVALMASLFLSVRRLLWKHRKDPDMRWLCNVAMMMETGLLAYAVNGAFLSRSYFDLFFAYAAIVIILKQLSENALQHALSPASVVSVPSSPLWPPRALPSAHARVSGQHLRTEL
jgi:probable O-glycosylation ligase (exosortase A-associated)